MEQYFDILIDRAMSAPHMVVISFAAAIAFIIGGIVLYKKRGIVKGRRWPGVTCALLGCVSLVTNAVQHIVL
ncbi:MAG: hypothetical protein LBV27_00515 [Oscillospiraceae bacterium]|jgi:hypothetical protein|nr:hypothetical protein [Oscillospiraceae bacterium]